VKEWLMKFLKEKGSDQKGAVPSKRIGKVMRSRK
jgi:hypothetical protein